jgi:hypothetical protein
MSDETRHRLFEWELHNAGWATATIHTEPDTEPLSMTVSYLYDSLRELARALLAIDAGAKEVAVPLLAEPGEHHLVLQRLDEDRIGWEARWYTAWVTGGRASRDNYELVGRGDVRWRTFRGAIVSELQRLLCDYGEDGYRERWVNDPFPLEELRRLERGA